MPVNNEEYRRRIQEWFKTKQMERDLECPCRKKDWAVHQPILFATANDEGVAYWSGDYLVSISCANCGYMHFFNGQVMNAALPENASLPEPDPTPRVSGEEWSDFLPM